MIMNMCIFGAVAAGPLIGGAQASFHAWRPLFWIAAGIAVLGLLLALLTFEDAPPADRSAPGTAGPSPWPPAARWPRSGAPRS